MISHLEQPTRTSCGPTAVAMLVGDGVRDVITVLRASRSERRMRRKDHASNVGEIARVLAFYGRRLEARQPGAAINGDSFGLLKVHASASARGWHWAAVAGGEVHDPLMSTGLDVAVWLSETSDRKVHFYPVTEVAG